MEKAIKKPVKTVHARPKRTRRLVCLLSDEECRIVERHLTKYRITNRTRWMRETLLASIHKAMEEDYPTLFHEHDMRR